MKGVIYYFSGTGNTKWVADKFKMYFDKYEIDLDTINLEKVSWVENQYDFFIIGTPIYFDNTPRIINKFAEALPEATSKINCIVFATNTWGNSAALDLLGKLIKNKGYNLISQVNIIMPPNLKFKNGVNVFVDKTSIKIMARAANKIKSVVKDFLLERTCIENTPMTQIYIKKIKDMVSSYNRVNLVKYLKCTDDCTSCGKCLRNCPCSNITLDNGKVVFHSNCVTCMRCMCICPQEAITFKGYRLARNKKLVVKNLNIV
ncbi:MAG: (Fe-S)-binding protein [Clostridiales bacterium]|nr:(Fe-S)-binding protein [Clostridiales bacterium]